MAQGVKAPASKPDDLTSTLGPTWWKERSSSDMLSSGLHSHSVAYSYTHTHTKKFKIQRKEICTDIN